MKLNELKYTEGSRKTGKRICRGLGSGSGKNGGSGQKGQNSRSGGGVRPGFEGGQNPIYRRLPKRGFTHYNSAVCAIVNLSDLEKLDEGAKVTPTLLIEKGLISSDCSCVKVLGNGTLSKKLAVSAHKFSKSAEKAITQAGGTVEVI